jgi:hypothetical protein
MFYGTPNRAGRPKGSNNKTSEVVRQVIADLLTENAGQLRERMNGLSDAEFVKCYASLARFVLPQQRAIIEESKPTMPDEYTIEILKGDGSTIEKQRYERIKNTG